MKLFNLFVYSLIIFTLPSCGYFAANTSLDESKKEGSLLEPQEVNSSKVVAVISQNQILPNFQHCLGLKREQLSAATRTAHAETIESLSPEGEVDKISAPMLMAVTKITSEICNDLINVEKPLSTRNFFASFSLDNSSTGMGDVSDSIQKLTSSCWGRLATDQEISMINKTLNENSLLKDKTNRDSALFICTAVLSSSQAIRF